LITCAQGAGGQRGDEPAGDIALAAPVDAAEADEQCHPRGVARTPAGDFLDDCGQSSHFSPLGCHDASGSSERRGGQAEIDVAAPEKRRD
jgi:hypothetical protein